MEQRSRASSSPLVAYDVLATPSDPITQHFTSTTTPRALSHQPGQRRGEHGPWRGPRARSTLCGTTYGAFVSFRG